jgi:hypothetical protein
MRKAHASAGGAILLILFLSSGEYAMTIGHLLAQFDGVVIARTENIFYPPWIRNLTTKYVIQASDGRRYIYYADPSEGDLGGFRIGTHLSKSRWHLDYEAEGQARNDFPLPLYLLWMVFDFGMFTAAVAVAIMIRTRERRTRELEDAVERGEELLREMDRKR